MLEGFRYGGFMQIHFNDGEAWKAIAGGITFMVMLFKAGHFLGQSGHLRTKDALADCGRDKAKAEQREREVNGRLTAEISRSAEIIADLERGHAEAMTELERCHALAVAKLEEKIAGLEESLTWHRAQGGSGPEPLRF